MQVSGDKDKQHLAHLHCSMAGSFQTGTSSSRGTSPLEVLFLEDGRGVVAVMSSAVVVAPQGRWTSSSEKRHLDTPAGFGSGGIASDHPDVRNVERGIQPSLAWGRWWCRPVCQPADRRCRLQIRQLHERGHPANSQPFCETCVSQGQNRRQG